MNNKHIKLENNNTSKVSNSGNLETIKTTTKFVFSIPSASDVIRAASTCQYGYSSPATIHAQ